MVLNTILDGMDKTEQFILLITEFPSDGCYCLKYEIEKAFNDFDDPQTTITPAEFKACTDRLTSLLRKWRWLPAEKELLGMELQIMLQITFCHVRGLTRRDNSHIFNHEESHSPASLVSKTQTAVEILIKVGIPEENISINHHIWDSQ
jgi:hypothetical protein